MAIPERYNKGYNIGVGGAVIRDGKVLMVRRASRRGYGNWQLPGGYIELKETIEEAVVREVAEESGVTAEVEGVLGLRNRFDLERGNGIYVVLLLRPVRGEPEPDGHEVDRAGYFTLDEIRALKQVPQINREIVQRVLAPDPRILKPTKIQNVDGITFTLFLG